MEAWVGSPHFHHCSVGGMRVSVGFMATGTDTIKDAPLVSGAIQASTDLETDGYKGSASTALPLPGEGALVLAGP